ncbi:GIY-YIG nuclease family protein [Candidatus Kaiserbacteria bacterium]|nr:GIY-YIG nuclease family protein [Candidatus Kaiserbacteria bacterium]
MMTHFVYMVRCADGTFYTGYTTDIEKRLAEHNGVGLTKTALSAGARYTRSRRPVKLVHKESFHTRSEALKREYAIKQLSRDQKRLLQKAGDIGGV